MKLINILVVDSYTIFSQGLIKQLSDEPEFYILPLVKSMEEIRKTASNNRLDIVILSNMTSIAKNMEVIKIIKQEGKKAKFVLLSHWYSNYLLSFSFKVGIHALITNSVNIYTLITIIKRLSEANSYFCPIYSKKIKKKAIDTLTKEEVAKIKSLSPVTKKQFTIIEYFVQGCTPKEVADKLNLSLKTINNHKRNIFLKNNLKTHVDIIRLGISLGLNPYDKKNILNK